MFVDIAQIPAEGLDIQFRQVEDILDPSGEKFQFLRPVEAMLHFYRIPTGVWVRGQSTKLVPIIGSPPIPTQVDCPIPR